MKEHFRRPSDPIRLWLDWSPEFATFDSSYYKHQQKMFLDFLRAGLVHETYQKADGSSGYA